MEGAVGTSGVAVRFVRAVVEASEAGGRNLFIEDTFVALVLRSFAGDLCPICCTQRTGYFATCGVFVPVALAVEDR